MPLTFAPVKGATIERYDPGEQASDLQPGDFILTQGSDIFGRLIRLGQALRLRGADHKYTYWNHVALIVDEQGSLIEALGEGVRETNISRYTPAEYHLVRLGTTADENDRAEAVRFARQTVGDNYGWLTIVCIGLRLLTGGKLAFEVDGQFICSGLVARAMERTQAIFNRDTEDIMPADLAKYYQVEPPPPGTPKGKALPPAVAQFGFQL